MLSKYKSDDGSVYFIQIRPETLTLALGGAFNTAPTDAATTPLYARGSSGRYNYGVNARRVRFQFDAPPMGYAGGGVLDLPWLDSFTWATAKSAATGTYQGLPITVLSFVEEFVH